jgi:hypothetical protein
MMEKTLTRKGSNKQNLVAIIIYSPYPECQIKGEEATRILTATDDDGDFNLHPYGQGKVLELVYETEGMIIKHSGASLGEDLNFYEYIELGRPSVISVERTIVYGNED